MRPSLRARPAAPAARARGMGRCARRALGAGAPPAGRWPSRASVGAAGRLLPWPAARRRARPDRLAMLVVGGGVGVVARRRGRRRCATGRSPSCAAQRALVTLTGTRHRRPAADPRPVRRAGAGAARGRAAPARAGLRRRRLAAGGAGGAGALHRPAGPGRRRRLAATVSPRGPPEPLASAGTGLAGHRGAASLDPRRRRAPTSEPGGSGPGPGRRRRRGHAARADRGLPRHRPDPPDGSVRHQPHAGRRLPARRRSLGRRPRSLARRRRGRRDRRVRPAGPHRAERAAGRRDGHRGPARARPRRLAPRCPRPRRSRGRPAAARPRTGRHGRVRAVGAGDGRDPPGRARRGATRWLAGCLAGWPRPSPCRRRPSWPAPRWWPRSRDRSAWWRSRPTWLVAPAVGPATVLGLLAGVVALVSDPLRPAARHPRGLVRRRGS